MINKKNLKTKKDMKFSNYHLLFSFILLVLIAFLVTGLVLYIRFRLKPPYCSGTIDPNQRYCENGNAIVGEIPEGVCSPLNEKIYDQNFSIFFDYLFQSIQKQSNSFLVTQLNKSKPDSWNIVPGNFFFATEELLRILPTDFGQNNTTPYGILSFFDSFASCITDLPSFCNTVIQSQDSDLSFLLKGLCLTYFETLQKTSNYQCEMPITDHNPQVYIKDKIFFNEIGLLGALSMNYQDIIVCQVQLPLRYLHLNYWSFNLYRTDDLSPDESCYPYRQINLASICPPLNCFTACSYMKTVVNPLVGSFDSTYFTFNIIIAMENSRKDMVQQTLDQITQVQTSDSPVLFTHVFRIPTSEGSMILSENIPNPNHLTSKSKLFDPSTQRFSMFLRLYPDPAAPPELLDDFIHLKTINGMDFMKDCFSVCKITIPDSSFLSTRSEPSIYPFFHYPIMISPPFDEKTQLSDTFSHIYNKCLRQLWFNSFFSSHVDTRNSVFNIFAPLNLPLLNGTIPYQGGYQAIQLAGNAQADNYDAQYRLSKAVCLQDNDLFLGFLVNHSSFQNVVYNSVNLVDTNKAFGYAAVNLNFKQDQSFPYYIVIASRSFSLLNQVEWIISSVCSKDSNIPPIRIEKIWIETGPSIESQIPDCHQLMFVERLYLNTRFQSIQDPTVFYQLQDIFGSSFEEFHSDQLNEDMQSSLKNVCAPLLDQIIPPSYVKLNYNPERNTFLQVFILVLLACLIIAFVIFWIIYSTVIRKKVLLSKK